MAADWYDDFMLAACDLAGRLSRTGTELDANMDLDPVSRLKLCIEDPDELENLMRSLDEFGRKDTARHSRTEKTA